MDFAHSTTPWINGITLYVVFWAWCLLLHILSVRLGVVDSGSSFPLLYRAPLYKSILAFYLFTHSPLMDLLHCFLFWPIMNTGAMSLSLGKYMSASLLGMCLGVGLMNHKICLSSASVNIAKQLNKFTSPQAVYEHAFVVRPHEHLFLLVYFLEYVY